MDKLDKSKIIKELISYYSNGNKAEFARKLGISPQGLSTWITRNTYDIEIIYANCEDISAEWLLTGAGEMLRSEREKQNVFTDETLQIRAENNLLRQLLSERDKQLIDVNQELGKLQERVSSFRHQDGESTGEVGLSGGGGGLPMPVNAPVISSVPEMPAQTGTVPTEKLTPRHGTQKPNP